MFDRNKPITTRKGYPVRIVDDNFQPNVSTALGGTGNLLAVVTLPSGSDVARSYYPTTGRYYKEKQSDYDLINQVEVTKNFSNVYVNGEVGLPLDTIMQMDKKAVIRPGKPRVGHITRTFEDGKLVSLEYTAYD